MITRNELENTFKSWLEPNRFQDVALNGLQVEGKDTIHKIICGVSANQALIDSAITQHADAIFVHHGLIWGGGIQAIRASTRQRLTSLLQHEISLFAYHLPLDAHPILGNNAALADLLELQSRREFAQYKGQLIGFQGVLPKPLHASELLQKVQDCIHPHAISVGPQDKIIRSIGICSGGAPEGLYDAAQNGLDAFLTGEITEWCQAFALENNILFIAAGHHATERFGAQRCAIRLQEEFDLSAHFIDIPNPA
jgi:dinuclear metal center YbgI/SA1388 family protein